MADAANYTFQRTEKKFWMSPEQFDRMMPVLQTYMKEDVYGYSKIRNIYCDSDDYYLIRRSNEKPQFKEKFRIRSYADFAPDTEVFVEIKRKVKGIGYKRRIKVPFCQAERLLQGEEIACDCPQIESELAAFIARYHPKKKIYLSYERIALAGKEDPSLRITLDHNIRYCPYQEQLDLERESRPLLSDTSRVLMEVKAPGRLPGWLVTSISYAAVYPSSFSKVGNCFTRFVAPGLQFGRTAAKPVVPTVAKRCSFSIINNTERSFLC